MWPLPPRAYLLMGWRRETNHGNSSAVEECGLLWPPHAPERHLGNQHLSLPQQPAPCNGGNGVSHQSMSCLKARMVVFQLHIPIVQPRHKVCFLSGFINESGKSTWFLKSRKIKVCEWIPDSLWPCFYYSSFPCKCYAGLFQILLPGKESGGPKPSCVLVLL